jgi:hypothetical protein
VTTIGATAYANVYTNSAGSSGAAPAASAQPAGNTAAAESTNGPAVTVTLSAAAQAALAAQSSAPSAADVAAAARQSIDSQLANAQTAAAASGDAPAPLDLSGLDRRSLYAVASNQGGLFSSGEQALATGTLADQFQAALAKPLAAARVTGDYAAIYQAAQTFLAQAGPEEKAGASWAQQSAAVANGLQEATKTPGVLPTDVPNDAVAAYVTTQDKNLPAASARNILDVASDVRTALDAQYAAADPGGTTTDGGTIDFSSLDDRSVAAIALNEGSAFSAHEVLEAKAEVRTRTATAVTASFSSGSGALGQDLMTNYENMSPEERQAEGWTPELFAQVSANYQISQKLGGSGGYLSALLTPDASGASGGASTLLDYLT